jgi:hypothetical protein
MTPDDLTTVQRSWTQLRGERAALVDALTGCFDALGPCTFDPANRAAWLFAAVDELVGLLAVPSRLATHARALGATWPDPHTAPCFAAEGQAWLDAARVCSPAWTDRTALAWKQAWLLLSDVLAAESLSPFVDERGPTGVAAAGRPDTARSATSLPDLPLLDDPLSIDEASTTPPNQGPNP